MLSLISSRAELQPCPPARNYCVVENRETLLRHPHLNIKKIQIVWGDQVCYFAAEDDPYDDDAYTKFGDPDAPDEIKNVFTWEKWDTPFLHAHPGLICTTEWIFYIQDKNFLEFNKDTYGTILQFDPLWRYVLWISKGSAGSSNIHITWTNNTQHGICTVRHTKNLQTCTSRDGVYIAISDGSRLYLYNTQTREQQEWPVQYMPNVLCVSTTWDISWWSDQKTVYRTNTNWDTHTLGTHDDPPNEYSQSVICITLTPDEQHVISGSTDGRTLMHTIWQESRCIIEPSQHIYPAGQTIIQGPGINQCIEEKQETKIIVPYSYDFDAQGRLYIGNYEGGTIQRVTFQSQDTVQQITGATCHHANKVIT